MYQQAASTPTDLLSMYRQAASTRQNSRRCTSTLLQVALRTEDNRPEPKQHKPSRMGNFAFKLVWHGLLEFLCGAETQN